MPLRRRRHLLALGFAFVAATAGSAEAITTKTIAVLMFKPQNHGTAWVDADQVRAAVWTAPTSANNFYREQSFGKWQLAGALRPDGDVFGWYTIPFGDSGSCVSPAWQQAAKAAAARDGFVESNYDVLIYVSAATGCPGRAWARGRSLTVIDGFTAPTIAHELGHAFGLVHASAWLCRDATGVQVPISGTCTSTEYGDYAVMGQTTSFHMNGFQKGALGFLEPGNTEEVTASGIYTLHPIERASDHAQVLRIPRTYDQRGSVVDYYYLESRERFGFDALTPASDIVTGISIRVAPGYEQRSAHSYLLEAMTPAATGVADAPLAVGATFTDPTRRVAVTPVSIASGVAQVRVEFY